MSLNSSQLSSTQSPNKSGFIGIISMNSKGIKKIPLVFIAIGIYFQQIKTNKNISNYMNLWVLFGFFSTSDIICDVPSIPNGVVRSSQKTYRESDQLHYACNEGYTYGERADVTCTESGWSPTPYCTGQPFP